MQLFVCTYISVSRDRCVFVCRPVSTRRALKDPKHAWTCTANTICSGCCGSSFTFHLLSHTHSGARYGSDQQVGGQRWPPTSEMTHQIPSSVCRCRVEAVTTFRLRSQLWNRMFPGFILHHVSNISTAPYHHVQQNLYLYG